MIKKAFVKKFVTTEVLQCPYSVETHQPLLHRDPESEKTQIYLYASDNVNEAMLSDMYPMVEKGYMIEWHQIRKTGLRIFLINCRVLGIDEIRFQDGDKTEIFSLEEFLNYKNLTAVSGWSKIPDWDAVPAERRPVTNPELQSVLLKFVQEIRRKACPDESDVSFKTYKSELEEKLILCNVIVPATLRSGKTADGTLTDKDIAGVTVVTDVDGNEWIPAFTDQMEYTPFANAFFKDGKIIPTLNRIPNLASGLPKSCKGIILNPDTASLSLDKGYLEHLAQMAQKAMEGEE